jgi:NADPH:quinone reductase-like Zn-dependent oxidoreductase
MPMAAFIHEKGDPGVFRWEPLTVPRPGPGEVLLRHTAIGVNFVDTYHRRGIDHPWKVPPLPCVLGFEAVGVIKEIGSDVSDFAVGDRVVYGVPPLGAYSEERVYPTQHLMKLPAALSDEVAAASFMKGLTAQYLIRRTYAVKPGDWVLVHAAAGGMGLILSQWCKHLGANVIGTVSTAEKAALAKANGCDYPILYRHEDFAQRVREITHGEGVHVVYESIGKDTLQKSLDCLRPLGMCAAYGHASGKPDPIDIINDLGARGSLFITRPAVMHYMAKREDMVAAAIELFEVLASGAVKVHVNYRYPLREVAKAHAAIESGKTMGSTVLLVE